MAVAKQRKWLQSSPTEALRIARIIVAVNQQQINGRFVVRKKPE